ncbi:MAG: 30S ribosomal protein S11, partial [Chlorobiaceae bacterium]|nr:30S ribosomal protein S11 [Chlorobiaceae bacterium]
MATVSRKKKKVKVTPEGTVHIKASFNNIMVTITDVLGNTVSWSSAGKNGFKGSKKNTPYASQITSEAA